MIITINAVDYRGSIVDGPGLRTVLYVQGCNRQCEGCHNPSTWDPLAGIRVEVKSLADEIKNKSLNRKLTISGGEPLLQYDAILELLKILENFDLALYTGSELEEVPSEMLGYLHYIKVGRFIHTQMSTTIPYIGSKNQKFLDLRGCNDEKAIVYKCS